MPIGMGFESEPSQVLLCLAMTTNVPCVCLHLMELLLYMYPECRSNFLAIKNMEYTTKITGRNVGERILLDPLGLDLSAEACIRRG